MHSTRAPIGPGYGKHTCSAAQRPTHSVKRNGHNKNTMATRSKVQITDGSPKELREIADSLEMAHSEIEKLKKYLDQKFTLENELEARIERLERENQEIRDYAADIEEYVLQVDSSSRKRNIVISGIAENKGENSDSLVLCVYKYLQPYLETLGIEDIDCAFRLGKKTGKARPILCKFTKEKTRNDIYAIRTALNDTEATTKVYLNDDLPQLINERRSKFRIISKLAKMQKIPVSYQNSQITVNNITYTHRNMDCLPNGVRLEDAKIVKVQGGLAFHSEHAWLSNFYPCQIEIQGLTFSSAEQAFQYTRAIRLKDTHLANMILRSRKAKEAKLLSHGNTTTTPEWDNDRFDVMRHVVTQKFTQNYELGGRLVSTGQQTLIEATIDGFWGANASITSKSIKDGSWMGANFLGKILMEVRNELRRDANYADFLNAPLRVTLDYTPPSHPSPPSTQGSAPKNGDTSQQVASQPEPKQQHTQTTQTRQGHLPDSGNNQPFLPNQTPNQGQSKKNKNRPASESSQEGVSPVHRPSNKKKARIYSPKSALPPVRHIEDLFACPEAGASYMDTGTQGANFV